MAVLGVGVVLGLGIAIWPYSSDSTAIDGGSVCVAARDGWHADRVAPPASEIAAVLRHLTATPRPSDASTETLDEYAATEREWAQRPETQRVNQYVYWRSGAGKCVPEGRHRLLLAGAVLLVTLGLFFVIRSLERRREVGPIDADPDQGSEQRMTARV